MLLPPTDTHFKDSDWDTYQLYQYEYAVNLCTQRRTALDCGAHVGIMSHRMAQQFNFVHSFEPVWHYYLTENMSNYTNWELHTIALGKTPGWVDFAVNESNTGNTHRVSGNLYRQRTIDSYGFSNIDLIKMDLEGAELDALEGAEQTIRQCRPVLMLELERTHPTTGSVFQLLKSWGYVLQLRKNADTVWLA